MKKNFYIVIVACILFAALMLTAAILQKSGVALTGDAQTDKLIYSCLQTGFAAAFVLTALGYSFGAKSLLPSAPQTLRGFLWCIPCLAVPLANFPFSALITGSATVTRPDIVPLFVLSCVITALFEEFIFRKILHPLLAERFKDNRYGEILTVICTSAIFGAWHLFNLLGGAGVGETLLQVGYAFLLGCMLSSIMIRTGNVWICVIIHALFNIGGLLIPNAGEGLFQDGAFWIATAVCGFAVAAHVCAFLLLRVKDNVNITDSKT